MSSLRSWLFLTTVLLIFLSFTSHSHETPLHHPAHFSGEGVLSRLNVERRSLAEANSSLLLAEDRTNRRDPFNGFKHYTGGWNISDLHYWASVGFTAAPLFAIASSWFILFGISLTCICLCYCCCQHEPYGYSRVVYAISLILLILFTITAIVGCYVLYTDQGKFHRKTSSTLGYVVSQANGIFDTLENVSETLSSAKYIGVGTIALPAELQGKIDEARSKINSSATTFSRITNENSKRIQLALDKVRFFLIIVAGIMLFVAFLGFLFSIFGLQCLVYTLIIAGWFLVTATFILSGVFLLLHNVTADACVAMDEWVGNPTAHTALDDVLPCMDKKLTQDVLHGTMDVSMNLVGVVDQVIVNVSNVDFPPNTPLYYNQSGPLMPTLCNPINEDYTSRTCASGEVSLDDAAKVWTSYVCTVSSSGICTTPGRITPTSYNQMTAIANLSSGLDKYSPYLVGLADCTFLRKTFSNISNDYCPDLRLYSKCVYIGLVMVSAAVMLSLIFWVVYGRERRHRVYTKKQSQTIEGNWSKYS